MKSKLFSAFTILIISSIACQSVGMIPKTGVDQDNSSPQNNQSQETSSPPTDVNVIGTVQNIRTQVYVGEPSNLQLIDGKTNLGNDDYVKVEDGGKARLTFPGPVNMLLYNQTEMDKVRLDYDENSNPRIVNQLIRGGFSGYVEPGSHLTIDLSFGVKVNVLGTHFFIIFDDKTGNLTIGKFDGNLIVTMPGVGDIAVRDGEMVDILSKGKLKRHFTFHFNLDQFDGVVDQCLSPIQGFNLLRNSDSLPLAGEETFEAKTGLPCDPRIPLTTTPPLACVMPVAVVRARVVDLEEGPDLRYFNVGRHIKNEEFTVEGRYRDWYQGQFPNGDKGWLYKDWITIPTGVDPQNICEIPYKGSPPTPEDIDAPCNTLVCP